MINAIVIGLILAVIYVPHIGYLTDKIYSIDRFFHFDYFVMSAGWAHLKGQTIFVDVNSNYSVGMTVLLRRLAEMLGGFNYASMARVIMLLGVVYWCAGFLFLRAWLKNAFIAGLGIFLAINLEMFHNGVAPIVWRFPSATVIRHLFDLGVFFCLLEHGRSGKKSYLWAASGLCAVSIVYMLDTGVYLTLSYCVYLAVQVIFKPLRGALFTSIRGAGLLLIKILVPFAGAAAVLLIIQGPALLTAAYWQNATEYSRLFLNGFGDLPVTYAIEQKQYFAFFFGLLIPVFYMGSLLSTVTLIWQGYFKREHVLVVFMSCYGMFLYHYYIYRSGPTSYDAVIVPAVFVLSFWLKQLWQIMRTTGRWILGLALCAGLIAMFIFNPNVKQYPNIFYSARSVGEDIVDLQDDVTLIQGLTSKDQAVPLISSFETRLLIDADRKPFFYYFPFIYSLPFDSGDFHGTEILTVDRLKRTIGQLQEKKPVYVFVERRLFERKLHPLYYVKYTALNMILDYLNEFYVPYQNGRYLCALKLK